MRFIHLFMLLAILSFCSGCLLATPYWIRRAAVHDDLILVKETNVIYRRYIPHGIRLSGNQKLINQVGPINADNNQITIFDNYAELMQSGIEFAIDQESEPHIQREPILEEKK